MCSSVVIDANILQVVAYISVVNIPPGMIECQLNDLSCWGENVDLLQRGANLILLLLHLMQSIFALFVICKHWKVWAVVSFHIIDNDFLYCIIDMTVPSLAVMVLSKISDARLDMPC